jgi:hypothetical protein
MFIHESPVKIISYLYFTGSLYDAKLVAINGGTELLLYGGHLASTVSNAIWKFTIATKTWELVTKMFQNRSEHIVFSVTNFSC